MKSFVFFSPYYFLLLVPWALSFLKSFKRHRRGSLIFSDLKTIEASLHTLHTQPKQTFKLLPSQCVSCLRHFCILSLIFALARPQMLHYQGKSSSKGIDIMLALDLSSSMLALDFSQGKQIMTRVEAVKSVLQEFIAKRQHDAIGLIAFAGNPYLVSPLTLNHDWLTQNLSRCQIGLIEDGTAIGSAIIMAINRLKDQKQSPFLSTASTDIAADTLSKQVQGRVLILLTDGVNNKGEVSPSLAADIALNNAIKIYTIGVGEGGVVPTLLLDDKGNILKNAWGQLQVAQAQIPIDEMSLKYIAEKTGGLFFQAKDKQQLASIYEAIDTLEKRDLPLHYPQHIQEYFFLAAGFALLFFALEWVLSHTRFQILP